MAAGARDLCTLQQVLDYAPGYDPNQDTNGDQLLRTLQRIITAESTTALQRGREFIAIAGAGTRVFDLNATHVRTRKLRVGDAAAIASVTVYDNQDTLVETVDSDDRVTLPRVRQEWEPIRQLWFPPSSPNPTEIGSGWTMTIVGTWGFPTVPANVVTAVAKITIYRYVTEFESTNGTAFGAALAGVDIPVLFASGMADLDWYFAGGLA